MISSPPNLVSGFIGDVTREPGIMILIALRTLV